MRRSSRPTTHGALPVTCGLLLAWGCGAAPAPLDPDLDWDLSSRPPGKTAELLAPPRPRVVPLAARRPWVHAAAAFLAVAGRERSEHGVGGHERTVLVDEGARAYAEGHPRAPWPTGARLVERLHPAGSDGLTLLFTMTKLAPGTSPGTLDWAFEVLDPSWRVAVEGDLSACARCHAEAPHAGVFGPPQHATVPSL
ncbi:MAG: hypothetical protein FJ095_05705 [Deltaproteobacteria bacterium]|nr:hypothetical protein [Deltaproteobacteria bacterium]